jgi:hypothetical protein
MRLGLRALRIGGGGGGGASVPDVLTAWNPADIGSMGASPLTNGNLTVSNNGVNSQWDMVRATASASSGARYYETVLDTTDAGSGFAMVGVAKAAAGLTSFVGADANGWAWQHSRNAGPLRFTGNASVAYGSVALTGVTIGILLDIDAGTLTFFRNGVSQGVAYSALSGTFLPAASGYRGSGVPYPITARFARSTWLYGLAGYKQWGEA